MSIRDRMASGPDPSGTGRADCEITIRTVNAINTTRTRSARTISNRRSARSVQTPAGRANTSHGRRCAVATPAIRIGSRVSIVASQGNATNPTPSAKFDAELAESRRR